MKKILTTTVAIAISGSSFAFFGSADKDKFLTTYADIALVSYQDTLSDAKNMLQSMNSFKQNPTQINFDNAKTAWLNSRESYGKTEIFRLSNGPIDAEEGWVAVAYGAPEGQLNAWPLDENMVDYTIDASGKKTSGNIIDTKGIFTPVGKESTAVNIVKITPNALAALNENGGDANVATGYHAIEFLLWGQDQDYSNFMKDGITNGAMTAGKRALSDFTSDKYAERRFDYLVASSELIISDLSAMIDAWKKGDKDNYRAALLGENQDKNKNISTNTALKQIFSGMGVFIKSELANERIAVAVLTPSEEDEHSCFSDNTHRDITLNYQGFKNVLFGTYNSVDYGFGAMDKLEDNTKLLSLIKDADSLVKQMNIIATSSRHFDYQIRPNDTQSGQIVKLKNRLRKIGDQVISVARSFGLNLNSDDVTDSGETQL